MYYYSKSTNGRLSELTKFTKDLLLGSKQNSMSKPDLSNRVKGEQKIVEKLPSKVEVTVTAPVIPVTNQQAGAITQIDLEQAIIWSEILGKPMSKRRERRYYGN